MKDLVREIAEGRRLDLEEALEIVAKVPAMELFAMADQLRQRLHDRQLSLCSIVNAKAGRCSEDCMFCAQSARYATEVESYDLVDIEQALKLARENESFGVKRYSLVTAGHSLSLHSLEEFRNHYKLLREKTSLKLCASMGFLTPLLASRLRAMGVVRYHCNLETSRSYFKKICTTHSWDDKVATILVAREAGLEICSGGIIGMGESLAQRLELAIELRELEVQSVPINILSPIPGTPFAHVTPLSLREVMVAVAMFRLLLPRAVLRIAGGRNLLGKEQHKLFKAGANGAIVGDYLTTAGQGLAEDLEMFERLGFAVAGKAISEEE